jgi:hypothetical protein
MRNSLPTMERSSREHALVAERKAVTVTRDCRVTYRRFPGTEES